MSVNSVSLVNNPLIGKVQEVLLRLDKDSDGKISFQEAKANPSIFNMCESFFPSEDSKPAEINALVGTIYPQVQKMQTAELKRQNSNMKPADTQKTANAKSSDSSIFSQAKPFFSSEQNDSIALQKMSLKMYPQLKEMQEQELQGQNNLSLIALNSENTPKENNFFIVDKREKERAQDSVINFIS